MNIFRNKKLVALIGVIIILLVLPLAIYIQQQQTQTQSQADQSTTLYFTPDSTSTPIQVTPQSNFSLDLMLNPGQNVVTLVKVNISFDPSKVTYNGSNAFIPNSTSFPEVVEGPVYGTDNFTVILSIGNDATRAITSNTKLGTLNLKAISESSTSTQISYTSTSEVYSAGPNDQASENVLSSTVPANINIGYQLEACTRNQSNGDIMMIVDISGSTIDNRASQKAAMKAFVNALASQPNQYNIGLISYASRADLNWSLQNGTNYTGLNNAIDTMPPINNASTGEAAAINLASQQFQNYGRPGIRKSIILLTDRWDSQAQNAANTDHTTNNTAYYIVAYDLSNSTIRRMLQDQATNTGGTFVEYEGNQTGNPTETDLLLDIASDVNCPIELPATPTPTAVATLTPTRTPTPTMMNPTFTPTNTPTRSPSPSSPPSATITSTPTLTATVTPIPTRQNMILSFTGNLHGIGSSGDSRNPDSTMSNKNPRRITRPVTVEALNAQNQVVADGTGSMTYSPQSGNFNGSATFGSTLPQGTYTVRIKTDQYIKQNFPGFYTLIPGQQNQLPAVTLIAGDVQGDNQLDILDYNLLLGCYSDLQAARNCFSQHAILSDLNDDGKVNQFDYNLFLRELSVRPGA